MQHGIAGADFEGGHGLLRPWRLQERDATFRAGLPACQCAHEACHVRQQRCRVLPRARTRRDPLKSRRPHLSCSGRHVSVATCRAALGPIRFEPLATTAAPTVATTAAPSDAPTAAPSSPMLWNSCMGGDAFLRISDTGSVSGASPGADVVGGEPQTRRRCRVGPVLVRSCVQIKGAVIC